MSSTRRSGIRMPWSSAAGDQPSAAAGTPDGMPSGETPATEASAEQQVEMPATTTAPAGTSSSPELLRDLVQAMRGVVTASRDGALASLRGAIEEAEAGMDAAAVERQAALRSKAESDITEIGAWERAEIERVRGEAVARVTARRATLDQELAEAAARRDAEQAALRARLERFTEEMTAFMAELDRISDPAAFAAAARRMPAPPEIVPAVPTPPPPAEAPSPAPEPAAESLPERLAELDQQLAEAEPAVPAEPAPESATGDVSTSIVVRGLGSFGAITSFKQALERAAGVSGVTLALSSSGEFVYTATHAAAADMTAAIHAVEPDAEVSAEGGSLHVKVTRPATR